MKTTLAEVLTIVAKKRAIVMFIPLESENAIGWECTIVLNGKQLIGVSEDPVAAALAALAMETFD